MSNSINNINYYVEQQCSVQWRAFLTAFAAEFTSKGESADLRIFMHSLGRNMAATLTADFSTGSTATLSDLEDTMNRIWFDLNWGWVRLSEQADCLLVEHNAAPFKAAFGATALSWTPALLEGIYAHWFETLGVDKTLRLTQRGASSEDGQLLEFQLKKQAEDVPFSGRR